MRLNLLFSILIFCSIGSKAQDHIIFFHVISENGIYLREKPNSKSPIIKKLPNNTNLKYDKSTNNKGTNYEYIFDYEKNDSIYGWWIYVETLDSIKGYVFNNYTEKNKSYNVAAKDGLFLREEASSNSKIIKKLEAGRLVQFLELSVDISDSLKSPWFKIFDNETSIGYVYSPFLLAKNSTYFASYCGHKLSSTCYLKNGTLNFFNYCISDEKYTSNDTVYLYEELFQMFRDQVIQINKKTNIDSVKIFFKVNGSIVEQFNPYIISNDFDFEDWDKKRIKVTPEIPYKELKCINSFYRIPDFEYHIAKNLPLETKNKLELRDTLVNLSGESENIAYIVYKNIPCTDYVSGCTLKIVYYKKEETITQYIDISFTSGC